MLYTYLKALKFLKISHDSYSQNKTTPERISQKYKNTLYFVETILGSETFTTMIQWCLDYSSLFPEEIWPVLKERPRIVE